MEMNEEENEVQIFVSSNEYEINQVCAILTDNNIPFVRKDDGSGSYINIYMGQSFQEKRIFVSKRDYNKSLELISVLTSNDINMEEEQAEEDESNKKHLLIRRSFGFLFLIMPILIGVIVIIIASILYS